MPSDKPQIRVPATATEIAALKRKAASEGLTLAGLLRRSVGLEPLPIGQGNKQPSTGALIDVRPDELYGGILQRKP